MVDIPHATMTDPDVHEPKGISTAAAGQAYLANGLGSGAWTTIATGDFNIVFRHYTSNSIWTKPANFIGCAVYCIGGGGGGGAGWGGGTAGQQSSFAGLTSADGGAPGTDVAGGAGGSTGSATIIYPGSAGQGPSTPTAVGGKSFGPFGANVTGFPYGTGGQADAAGSGGAGGGGAASFRWFADSQLSATANVTIGIGGSPFGGTGATAGVAGYVVVFEYVGV